jgi:hypothetical protein
VVTGDGITASGLNVGSLAAWQESVVRFSVRVDAAAVPTLGRTAITNTAHARADGTGTVAASIPLLLGVLNVISGAAGAQTGPAESIALAFALAALATGAYAVYARTSFFGRRMAAAEIRALAGKPLNFAR